MAADSIILGKIAPEFIKDETLPVLLSESFKQHSAKEAFIFKERSISYAELDNWSNAIALYLQQQGVRAGDTVGVWHTRSLALPVAILGILKAGAAYVPLDREMPQERIEKVFTDIKVKTYFSDTDAGIHCPPLAIPEMPSAHIPPVAITATSADWAYVLFTSGSTGTPKGIPISHHNICHLVRSEQDVLGIRPEDRVYQGFSVSFDMWCEEVWVSLFAGATIWIADAFTVKAIDELSTVLTDNKITILHAVPSILAIIDEVPALRIVNAGGEACTKQVLDKWGTPERTFINSYGPTETTVTSNMAMIKAGAEITIGPPLPNYHLAVVDEQMRIVPRGEKGEMIITGPGVSKGYFKLPELTAAKFLPNPFPELPGDTLYKSGDAVLFREDGFIEFHGRFDDQVKLRGYRIELGEIESRMNHIAGVSSAAVAIREDNNAQEQLVGYVVLQEGLKLDEDKMRKELAAFLAPYMVPVAMVQLSEMPRMPSGKINRKSLPLPESFKHTEGLKEEIAINTQAPIGERVLKVLNIVFPGKELNLEQDFFTDLGGHSLLAATLVSHLRQKAGLPLASLKDVYENRPLSAFVACLEQKQQDRKETISEPFHRVSNRQYYLCNLAQTLSLIIVYGLLAIEIIFPYLSYYYLLVNNYNHVTALFSAFVLYCTIPPIFALLILTSKWLIIGKIKEGDYPLWGWYYYRWWLWKAMKRLLPSQFIVDTPLYPRYLRLLGVKVDPTAQLSLLQIGAEDLVTIGKNVSTSSACAIDNATVENGWLKLRKVHLGDHAYLGSSAIVCGGATIEAYGELQDLSCLPEHNTIGKGEVWNGSPAVKIKTVPEAEFPEIVLAPKRRRNKYAIVYLCSLFIFPLIVILPLFPTLYTLYVLDDHASDYDFSYLWQTPFLAMSYLFIFILVIGGISRLLQIKMTPGTYSIYSFTYYRKWMKDQLMNLSLTVLHPLYATVYIPMYYRLLGAKVGNNSEISTASDVTHHLTEIGEGSFIADAVILGEHEVRNEALILERTKIGNNSFVGNSGLIPQGYTLGDNMLIGVLSKAPTEAQQNASGDHDWFGSPPIGLPARQKNTDFEASLTYHPSPLKKLSRALVEGLRIVLPQTFIIISSVLFIAYAHNLLQVSVGKLLLLIPVYYLLFMAIPLFVVTVILKWLLVGRYKKTAMPMYSLKVWLSEAVTTFYEALSVPFLLDSLRGTMWLPILLRLMGVKTGKKVWLNTTDITEFDMVTIGDEAMLNEDCGPQTHLFEDRIMKIGSVHIGAQTTIGSRTIILYDSVIGQHVSIESLSLVMKGESLTDNTAWTGSPVKAK
ncbi:peptide synthetase [Taibaiella sp. KBW10]|uniref:Pls/PosA family non-ribosomal peptide synthetase n=1 Tax=Taibaiella sp. KBW10 TaxID=2153357 RepID=UPI000F5AA2D8|nr:Pls/PosA family non-ribosomal peptide synthetase [Taibaiella sp. KBW10]RQO29876.1 peptide synthetase [Taibaiella sp. KBW10]